SSLGGSTSVGGVQNTNKFLDKSTWTLAAILVILVLFSSITFQSGYSNDSTIFDNNTVVPQQTLPNAGALQTQEHATQDVPAETQPANYLYIVYRTIKKCQLVRSWHFLF